MRLESTLQLLRISTRLPVKLTECCELIKHAGAADGRVGEHVREGGESDTPNGSREIHIFQRRGLSSSGSGQGCQGRGRPGRRSQGGMPWTLHSLAQAHSSTSVLDSFDTTQRSGKYYTATPCSITYHLAVSRSPYPPQKVQYRCDVHDDKGEVGKERDKGQRRLSTKNLIPSSAPPPNLQRSHTMRWDFFFPIFLPLHDHHHRTLGRLFT